MKRMIAKIALAVLVMNSMPVHASLGKSMQDGTRSLLQRIGNNSGRIAVFAAGLMAITCLAAAYEDYNSAHKRITEIENGSRSARTQEQIQSDDKELGYHRYVVKNLPKLAPIATTILTSLIAGSSYALAKACGWLGSKI